MSYKVFVDGQEGTTGLEINERLENHGAVEILYIAPDKRKDPDERSKLINAADVVFLCLPDSAASESVSLVRDPKTRVIDASTAHRTHADWAYGLPELGPGFRQKIGGSRRVSVPGCYATGFNVLMHPLVKEGIAPGDYPVTCHAISGYSGGGKKLIAKYSAGTTPDTEKASVMSGKLKSPCFYSLGLKHKHLPEMQKVSGLENPPLFTPIVADFYRGMTVAVPILPGLLSKRLTLSQVYDFFAEYYRGQRFVKVMPFESDSCLEDGFLFATGCNGTNRLEIFIFGSDEQILLVSRLDNLGKGASGAAVQNMNLMLGFDEGMGLTE